MIKRVSYDVHVQFIKVYLPHTSDKNQLQQVAQALQIGRKNQSREYYILAFSPERKLHNGLCLTYLLVDIEILCKVNLRTSSES